MKNILTTVIIGLLFTTCVFLIFTIVGNPNKWGWLSVTGALLTLSASCWYYTAKLPD